MDLPLSIASATILFPEFYQNFDGVNFKPCPDGKLAGNKLTWTKDNFTVEARISPFYLPEFLCDNDEVKEKILQPALEMISSDFNRARESLERLRKLHMQDEFQDNLYYETSSGKYYVYDYSRGEIQDGMRILVAMSKLPAGMIKHDYHNEMFLASLVRGETAGRKVPCFEANSLMQGIERLVAVYGAVGNLREIADEHRLGYRRIEV
ncbi:hypothetical protein KY311_03830 [Candidatus Woesearchaeota archaeon]|nr:hypothetical protein [Candidatus Woesearchaeota archaeon]